MDYMRPGLKKTQKGSWGDDPDVCVVSCLPHTHEDVSLVPIIADKKLAWQCAPGAPALGAGRDRQYLELSVQPA